MVYIHSIHKEIVANIFVSYFENAQNLNDINYDTFINLNNKEPQPKNGEAIV